VSTKFSECSGITTARPKGAGKPALLKSELVVSED